jgi:hypothetical protein
VARTATIGHNQPSLCTETKNVAPAAGFLFFWGRKSPGGLWRVRRITLVAKRKILRGPS